VRTLGLPLAGTVILALLGGLSVAVAAQAEETDSGPVTSITGVRLGLTTDTSEEEWSVDGSVGHARIFRVHETVEWSDPRLPTDKVTTLNFDMYNIGEFRELPMTGTSLLEGPDGYWTGTTTGFCDQDGDCFGIDILTGHGAYEGLFATLHASPLRDPEAEGDQLWEGLIFEGEMPPMPDQLEPSAAE